MTYSMRTENKSFIDMWRYLQRYGISNNLFMLQTHDADLVDFSIDKYQMMDREDPSFKIYREKVIQEAKNNIWFYFRELIMVPTDHTMTEYKHFELTPEYMMMIYLYDKKKSFINLVGHNTLCLQFIWNLHRSLYSGDLVLTNNYDEINEISNNIKKYIANMPCQVPFGGTQAISDGIAHSIICNLEAFKLYYIRNGNMGLQASIYDRYRNCCHQNNETEYTKSLFILEKDMPIITYSYIAPLLKERYRLYINCPENLNMVDSTMLNNFLKGCFALAYDGLYDIDDTVLNDLYLI